MLHLVESWRRNPTVRHLVSIVTVLLNKADALARTIASMRPFVGVEYLVVDGSSTDMILVVVMIAAWTSEPDGGIYEAIHKCLRRLRMREFLTVVRGNFGVGAAVAACVMAPFRGLADRLHHG